MTPAALAAIHPIPLKTTAITIKPKAAPILSGKPSGFMFEGSPAMIYPSPKKRKSRALSPDFPGSSQQPMPVHPWSKAGDDFSQYHRRAFVGITIGYAIGLHISMCSVRAGVLGPALLVFNGIGCAFI
jgi:hypothetical protein